MAESSVISYKSNDAASRSFRTSKRQFLVMKNSITGALNSIEPDSEFVLQEYLSSLKDSMKDMQKAHEFITQNDEITSIEDEKTQKKAKEKADIEEETMFQELVTCRNDSCVLSGKVKAALAQIRENVSQGLLNNSSIASTSKYQAPKLQKLNIPKFDGERKNWPPFKELFVNLIHNDPNRSGVEKLSYLKEAMTGKVENSLKDVQLTEAAYLETWERLCERYDNVCAVVKAHLKDLFKVEKIKYESQLPELLDSFEIPLRNLKASGEKTNDWSSILAFMLYTRLDSRTQREFENSIDESNKKFYTYEQLQSFVSKRAIVVEERESDRKASKLVTDRKMCSNTTVHKATCCVICKLTHRLFECEKFLGLNPAQRYDIVKKNKLCGNCFLTAHTAKDCRNPRTCRICGKKHHTLLHSEVALKPKFSDASLTPNEVNSNNAPNTSDLLSNVSCCLTKTKKKVIILPTATVRFKVGNIQGFARILLDGCSQANLISRSFVNRWKIPSLRSEDSTAVHGVGGLSVISTEHCNLCLFSRTENFHLDITADIVPGSAIPYRLRQLAVPAIFEELQKLSIADVAYSNSELDIPSVDILLGAEFYEKVLKSEVREINGAFLRSTYFGWTVSGRVDIKSCAVTTTLSCHVTTTDVQNQLQKFWELEEVEAEKSDSWEAQFCHKFFEETYSRDQSGRFVVRLPKCGQMSDLAPNLNRAIYALHKIERSLDKETLKLYVDFMKEYLDLNHMSEVQNFKASDPAYYIPHRIVLRPESTTTKARVVFNASSKTASGKSLNDILLVGPVLQADLFDILIRWRKHRYVFCSDISKMYRCVIVHKDDRKFQRIVWRESSNEPIKVFELNTVTYGEASASFLATKCLDVLANELKETYPAAAKAIHKDVYMDDFITGSDSLAQLCETQTVVHNHLLQAGFPLRKYVANHPQILERVQPENLAQPNFQTTFNAESVSVLGITWNPEEDVFSIKLNLLPEVDAVTKKIILSQISRTFDPLGFVAPLVIRAKLILQDVWRESLNWDDSVSEVLREEFTAYIDDLKKLDSCKIRRSYFKDYSPGAIKFLVGFSDASSKAYCACVYMCSASESYLVCSKTRVAPLKVRTIPELELEAALLLSTLMVRVCRELQVDTLNIRLFSDSTVVLGWLKKELSQLSVFVRNRVVKILKNHPSSLWSHVDGEINPADLGTRGLSSSKFITNVMWFNGPSFIKDLTMPVSNVKVSTSLTLLPEIQDDSFSLKTFIEKFSSYSRLINVTSYLLRIFSKSKSNSILLSAEDKIRSFLLIVKFTQQISFPKEYAALTNKFDISKKSVLLALSPFCDEKGLLRVGGRISNSNLSLSKKHPIIMSAKSHFLLLYTRYVHVKYFHCSQSFLINFIKSRFWITGGLKRLVKRVFVECTLCKRYLGVTSKQKMGDLPEDRVRISRPFSVIGIDFAGPFTCKCVEHRCVKYYKVYLAVFVCFVVRAVHLELVSALSSEAFLAALKRFCSRRGCPAVINSDNGSNFKGAKNFILKNCPKISDFAASEGICWKFTPTYTPHCGGLWEAVVKPAKHHLERVTNGQVLNYEEFNTIFTQIEGILNSRPLSYRYVSDENVELITPGHFLVGDSLLQLPEVPELVPCIKLSTRYRMMRNIIDSFWSSWRKDYLNQLQVRSTNKLKFPNLQVNDIVLIKKPQEHPKQWPFGRIVKTLPDSSGLVRKVSVLVKGKTQVFHVIHLIKLLDS